MIDEVKYFLYMIFIDYFSNTFKYCTRSFTNDGLGLEICLEGYSEYLDYFSDGTIEVIFKKLKELDNLLSTTDLISADISYSHEKESIETCGYYHFIPSKMTYKLLFRFNEIYLPEIDNLITLYKIIK